MAAPPPPPRRTVDSAPSSRPSTPESSTWTSRMKAKGSVWGKKAMDKSFVISDNLGHRVNDIAEKRFGTEAFWPTTGDLPQEMDKCARILRAFTVEGVMVEDKKGQDKKQRKVFRKIPSSVIQQARGIAIFTSMRTGIAPLGGAGGAGVVVAKLPDGTWSAPASISPNNFSTGLLFGVDVYDCVLVIRSQVALDSFSTHKATLGAEIGVAAGPYGAGAAVEAGKEKSPVFSYVRSRGMYAGIELVGQVFVERFDENGAMYHWPGVKAGDILSGKVRVPVEAANLQQALKDAESGRAQREKGEALDMVVVEGADNIPLGEGEVLKLPPTPEMTDGTEHQSDPETEKVHYPSYPGSRNTSDTHVAHHATAPALPARRPVVIERISSTSHYSHDDDDVPPPLEHLPAYDDFNSEAAKVIGNDKEAPPPANDHEPMTEAEAREWEQFNADQRAGQQGSQGDDTSNIQSSAQKHQEESPR